MTIPIFLRYLPGTTALVLDSPHSGTDMSEETLQMHAGFEPLQAHLKSLVQLLLTTDPRTLAA